MKHRLTDTRRASLEGRLLKLRAYLEPDKISNIVDSVSPDQVDIKPVLDKIIKYMEGAPESTSIKEKKAVLQTALIRTAMEMGDDATMAPQPPPHKESPMEEEHDLENPALHKVEDLEQIIQSMDDDTLMQEIEALEERMKQDLNLEQSGENLDPDDNAPAPEAHAESNFDSNPEEDEEMPKLAPEQKMALLMSLPEEIRAKKAASLRALANALEPYDREVSQDHNMHGGENDALMHDYEDENEGSMKDVKAHLANKVASLIKMAEETEEEAEEEMKKDETDDAREAKASAAVIGLALRHLQASMQREAEMPEFLKDIKEEKDEEKEDGENGEEDDEDNKKEASFVNEKRAILQARLASMRRKANVDGKSMKTPKEVPSPEGTTEDELHGDAKIQYQNALGGTHMSEIQMKRQKLPTDKQVAGNDEPNSLYMANRPVEEGDKMTSETDSAKDVNNKRVLKDMGEAVQSSSPASPDKQMEMGSGSHQKAKEWQKAKEESDMTPHGERLVGLAEIKERTSRALKLASKMAAAKIIRTQAHLEEEVVKLAAMDDAVFEQVASFFESTVAGMPKKAGEIPPQFKEHVNGPEFKAHEGDPDDKKPPFEKDEEEDEDENHTASRKIRRANQRDSSLDDRSIRQVASAAASSNTTAYPSNGIRQALNVGNVDNVSYGRSGILDKVASLDWSDARKAAKQRTELDDLFFDNGRPR